MKPFLENFLDFVAGALDFAEWLIGLLFGLFFD